MNERSNRTRKAQAIAAALWAAGVTDHYQVGRLSEVAWRLAAHTGWHIATAEGDAPKTEWTDASSATRSEVADLIKGQAEAATREAEGLRQHETDDVFARIAAPHTGPQDPDAPIPSAVPMSWADADAADEEQANADGYSIYPDAPADGRPHPAPPMHCTEFVAGDPAGCARCGEAKDLHPTPDTDWAEDDAAVDAILASPIRARSFLVPTDRDALHAHLDQVAARHPAARHTLACLAGGGRCQPGTPC